MLAKSQSSVKKLEEDLEHIVRKEEICLGHQVRFKKDCYNCIKDDFNKNCSDYKPLTIGYFYVKEVE